MRLRLLLLVLLALACVTVAHATDAPALTPAHSGLWFDPAADGQGVDLTVYEQGGVTRVFAITYLGASSWADRPFWAYASGPASEAAALPLLEVVAFFGLPAQGVPPAVVGDLSLIVESCNRIRADIVIDNVTAVSWHLQPLLFDQGAGC